MDKTKIKRINDLFAKKKSIGLTKEEQAEQELLHKEYLEYIKGQVKSSLEQAAASRSASTCSCSDPNCHHKH
jgi:uncharacterized protein YnzC (UPF0291/DUF896 family)